MVVEVMVVEVEEEKKNHVNIRGVGEGGGGGVNRSEILHTFLNDDLTLRSEFQLEGVIEDLLLTYIENVFK